MSEDRPDRPLSAHPASARSTVIKIVRASLLATLAAASVAACGGGGGGGSMPPSPILPPPPIPPAPPPPPPPPPSPPASFYETTEYFGAGFTGTDRSGLAQIHASSAYAAGATGQGVTVAVIDSGVDSSITELSGQVSGTFDIFASTRPTADTDPDGHGTLVSSVIAAKKDNHGIHGVAFNANILSIRTDTPGSCQMTGADEGCTFDDSNIAAALNYAVAHGAKVVNISLGGDGGVTNQLRNSMVAAVNAGVLISISAGNDAAPASGSTAAKGVSPSAPASLAGDPTLLGRVVAVGSVTPQGKISDFSNRAAQTRNFYLLAPGEDIITAGLDNKYFGVTGTSFASPHVAGALALMVQLFPNLSPTAAMQALLMTADDYVDPAIDPVAGVAAGAGADAVSGVGIMNLQRAFSPIGATSLSLGGAEVPLGAALAPARGALGDWVQASGAFNGLVFQDVLKRGFRIDESTLAGAQAPFADLGVRARYARAQSRSVSTDAASFSWFAPPPKVYDPRTPWADEPEATFEAHVNFAGGEFATGRGGGPQRLVPSLTLMDDPSGPATLDSGASWASISHAFGPVTFDLRSASGAGRSSSGVGVSRSGANWATRIGFTSMADAATALGGTLQSRFGDGRDGARLSAVSFENTRQLGAWQLSSSFEAAAVVVDRINVGGLWTSAWSLSAQHRFAGGDLGFTVAQPRRAEGGSIAFSGAVDVAKSGALVFEQRIAGLTPSGRETDLETVWRRPLDASTTIEAAGALSLQPNHVANADPATALWVSLRRLW